MATQVYLGLGSNLAEPISQLRQAIAWLGAHDQIELLAQSPVYQSPALVLPGADASGTPDYLNMVVEVTTELSADDLLTAIKQQEAQQGRDVGAKRWSSRPIDVDILTYGQSRINTPQLTVPHAGISARDFVLLPWRDLAAETVIPTLGTVADCAAALGGVSAKKIKDSLA